MTPPLNSNGARHRDISIFLGADLWPEPAELAHFCGIDPSIRHRIDEEKEARAISAQSLQMRTEALRAKNEAARQERQNRQNLSPWQRGYRSF